MTVCPTSCRVRACAFLQRAGMRMGSDAAPTKLHLPALPRYQRCLQTFVPAMSSALDSHTRLPRGWRLPAHLQPLASARRQCQQLQPRQLRRRRPRLTQPALLLPHRSSQRRRQRPPPAAWEVPRTCTRSWGLRVQRGRQGHPRRWQVVLREPASSQHPSSHRQGRMCKTCGGAKACNRGGMSTLASCTASWEVFWGATGEHASPRLGASAHAQLAAALHQHIGCPASSARLPRLRCCAHACASACAYARVGATPCSSMQAPQPPQRDQRHQSPPPPAPAPLPTGQQLPGGCKSWTPRTPRSAAAHASA